MKEIKNAQEFNAIKAQDKPVLLDFYADWCGPCQALLPTVEKPAEKYRDEFLIRKVNVDRNPELSRQFNIRSIPAYRRRQYWRKKFRKGKPDEERLHSEIYRILLIN